LGTKVTSNNHEGILVEDKYIIVDRAGVRIQQKSNFLQNFFSIPLIGVSFIGVVTILSDASDQKSPDKILPFLPFAALFIGGFLFILFLVAWQFSGEWRVSIKDNMVSVATQMFGVALGRPKLFPINELTNVRIEDYTYVSRGNTVTRCNICAGQNLVILKHLKKQQAPAIADAIEKLVNANLSN
jgi:hypothetical protein